MGATVIVVAGLLVRDDGRILIAQRPEGKKRAGEWEFPGGKAEAGETPEEALRRELREELGAEVDIEPVLERVAHDYPDLRVEVLFFPCRLRAGAVVERREHARLEWVEPARMAEFPFVEADRALLPRFASWAVERKKAS
jgi:8-oxo-dGTP diphosphatase